MASQRKQKPFATAKRCKNGWHAVTGVGLASGPWETEREAQRVADRWNASVEVKPLVSTVL